MKIEELKNRFILALDITLHNIDMEAVNEILDNRDEDLFSEAWTMAHEQTKDYKPDSKLEEEMNEARELIFKQVFRMTGSTDLSAYISDDFELIVIHNMCDTNNKWVHKLSEAYLNYEIPQ